MSQFLFFALLLAVSAAIAYGVYLYEKQRSLALEKAAKKLGLAFRPKKDRAFPSRFHFLNDLDRGSSRFAHNMMEGEYRGHRVTVFDYRYTTGSGKSRQTHDRTFCLLWLPFSCPELRIYPEGVFHKLGQALGFDDIDFESVEFSNAYVVESQDKEFAYAICHPRFMEMLLRQRDTRLEFEQQVPMLGGARRLEPSEIQGRLDWLVEIRKAIPSYLYQR